MSWFGHVSVNSAIWASQYLELPKAVLKILGFQHSVNPLDMSTMIVGWHYATESLVVHSINNRPKNTMELWTSTYNENITIINKLVPSVFMLKEFVESIATQFLRGKNIRLSLLFLVQCCTRNSPSISEAIGFATALKWYWFWSPGSHTAHGTKSASKWCQKDELLGVKRCSGLCEMETKVDLSYMHIYIFFFYIHFL